MPKKDPRDWTLTRDQEPPTGARAIKLSQKFVAWVDDEDYERINDYGLWSYAKNYSRDDLGYAVFNTYTRVDGKWKCKPLHMHTVILGRSETLNQIDHAEHRHGIKVIDNRKCNIRHCNSSMNSANRRNMTGSRSKFKGVGWDNKAEKWKAAIYPNRNKSGISLGRFIREEDAARAYDTAAVIHYGEFALTNFDVEGSPRSLYGEWKG